MAKRPPKFWKIVASGKVASRKTYKTQSEAIEDGKNLSITTKVPVVVLEAAVYIDGDKAEFFEPI